MPPGRKPTRTREEFVEAAIALADEQGLEQLSLRALGSSLGSSTTAVYRYFLDKGDLVTAMRESLLAQMISGTAVSTDPSEQIIAAARTYRELVRQHPCLSAIMTLPARDNRIGGAVQLYLLELLEQLGLADANLARGYQQLESFVIGSTMFDYSGTPHHLSDRKERFSALGHLGVKKALKSAAAVEANNEAAFDASLRAILTSLVAQARV